MRRLGCGAALAVLCAAAGAQAQNLERAPYLQTLTPTSVIVVWTTDSASEGVVRYGTSPQSLTQTASGGSGTQHEVKLTGLVPDTRYYYSVGSSAATLAGGDAEHYFVTAPTAGTKKKFRAWIVGDSGTGGSDQAAVRDAMLARVGPFYRPHLYLHMGDMAYSDGTTSQFTSRFFGAYAGVLANTVVWPTLGNHEGHSSDSGSQSGPYYTAYVLPKAAEAGGLPSGTEAYYSFDYANVHFIVLDSHDSPREPSGAMLTWAKNDLASTNQDWVIAYWHHPAYTKGTHDSDSEGQLVDMRENALPILEAGGVDLVLAGHSHIYERSFLVDGAYDTPTTAAGKIKDNGDGKPLGSGPYTKLVGQNAHDGAVYVVAGHGGAGISGPANHPLMYFSEKIHGSCIMDVQENRLSVINVRKDGVVSDGFTIVKGNEALVVAAPDGSEKLDAGSQLDIRWATVGSVPNVKLEYSIDDGASWIEIAASIPNTGSHSWTVPAVDTAQGLVRVSSVAKPSVFDESNAGFSVGASAPKTVIPFGSTWKYHDQGVDLGAGWEASSFDDGSWPEGPGQLGYGDGDEATLLTDADPNHPSVYFRKTIALTGPVLEATLALIHDDGVAVWVNGTQVFAKYMDNGTDYSAWSGASSDNESATAAISLSPNPFVVGDNVIAAMVKQSSASSSDVSFDLELTVTQQASQPDGGSGSGGGSGSSGAAGSGAGGSGSGGGSAAGAGDGDGGGCGCRMAPVTGSSLALAGAALGLLLARRRRR